MCGRFTQERPTSELAEIFGAEDLADDPGGRYNVAPTDEAVVVVERDERRAVVRYRWGLVPHWSTDTGGAARRINARSETVAASPSFRDALARRRCIVPVDSFYEWRRDGSVRRPFRIVRSDGQPFALAGIWAGRREPGSDQVLRTFSILTAAAVPPISSLHDRMPVALPPARWDAWLEARPRDRGELLALLSANDAAAPLEIYEVPRLVNSVRNDGPELIARLGA